MNKKVRKVKISKDVRLRRGLSKELQEAVVPVLAKYRKKGLSWDTLGWYASNAGQLHIAMGFSSELPQNKVKQ